MSSRTKTDLPGLIFGAAVTWMVWRAMEYYVGSRVPKERSSTPNDQKNPEPPKLVRVEKPSAPVDGFSMISNQKKS